MTYKANFEIIVVLNIGDILAKIIMYLYFFPIPEIKYLCLVTCMSSGDAIRMNNNKFYMSLIK